MENVSDIWNEVLPSRFARELCAISNEELMRAFLRDVMTERELREVGARLRAAEMLRAGATYTQIVAETKLSSRTVARISEWLKGGAGGYASVLNRAHTKPAQVD